ncbi:MAG TPA: hypothetical protein VLH59_11300 [Ignavibacteriaceae bacterium]|nr:hypothetical protein [Ignavibacteriaceae bacterium]
MIKKHFFIILISYFLVVSPDFICPIDFQIDSLENTSGLSSDSIRNIVLDYNLFSEFESSKLFLPDLTDSLVLQLQINLLSKKLEQNYIFQSSMSEQWRIEDQLTNYIKFQKRLELKSELGVFSEMLGHARNLTAVILAILHVIKYNKGLYR